MIKRSVIAIVDGEEPIRKALKRLLRSTGMKRNTEDFWDRFWAMPEEERVK